MKIVMTIMLIFFGLSQVHAVEKGDSPPDCSALFMDSQQALDLKAYIGKVVLLDFWASWCPPCKKSVPFLNQLQQSLNVKGLEIIALNVDEDPEDARQFLKNFPVRYQVALDPNGDCAKDFQVKAMPSSYFIDRKGVIRLVHLGFKARDKKKIQQTLESLLSEK